MQSFMMEIIAYVTYVMEILLMGSYEKGNLGKMIGFVAMWL
jgi:hypothetical protein